MGNYAPESVGFRLHENRHGKKHQKAVIVSAIIACAIALLLPPLSLAQQFWVIIIPVGVFGVSHGGADPWILQRLMGDSSNKTLTALALYALAAGSFVALIVVSPLTALFAFLFLSIWHFGMTDEAYLSSERNLLLLWLSGSMPVIGPIAGHPEQTGQLFAWLLNLEAEAVIGTLSMAGPALITVWLSGLAVLMWRQRPAVSARTVSELLLSAIALYLLPPLVAFAFYFCFIHTLRHFISVDSDRDSNLPVTEVIASLIRRVLPATSVAILLAMGIWASVAVFEPDPDFLAQGVRVLFWGLAALTLPHSFLVHFWWRRG